MLFLAHWARKLSWQETAVSFRSTWDKVCQSVEYVVQWGLEHRQLGPIVAIGVDEIQYAKGHKYLSRMNRNQRGCSIVIRGHDSRGCYGKRTCGTLRRPDCRRFVLLRPGCCDRDASHRLLRRGDDAVPLHQPDPHLRLPGVCLEAA